MKNKFLQQILSSLYPLLVLEDIISHKTRFFLQKIFGFVSILLLLASLFVTNEHVFTIRAVFCFSIFSWLWLFCVEAYFYSMYEYANEESTNLPFEVARILYYADNRDLTDGFLLSDFGDEVMKRLECTETEIKEFIRNRSACSCDYATLFKGGVNLFSFIKVLFDTDEALQTFLIKKNVRFKEFQGAFLFVLRKTEKNIDKERFWSRERLETIPAIGKNWAYGETFMLERFGRDLTTTLSSHFEGYRQMHQKTIKRLQSVLLKSKGANALVISEDEASRMDVISLFSSDIKDSKVLGGLSSKRVFLVDTNILIEHSNDKLSFERNFEDLLIEAHNAQNVILVFPFISSFFESVSKIGSDALSILRPFFLSSALHVIGLDSKEMFETYLSNNASILENFELVKTDVSDEEGIVHMLEEEVLLLEKQHRFFFSFLSLLTLKDGVKRYFDSFDTAKKAKDLILEAIPFSATLGSRYITAEIISSLIESKTGVPTSKPKKEEQQLLLHLEEKLHERIVGQDEAIKALSEAIRRSRAGISNPNRPIGSFLFLGSTGVGKTETTKALAQIFFGDENQISRFDCSEFAGTDGLARLIGFFGNESQGVLVRKIKEKPYGVVLLDEFEKASHEVHNLFLQILDEGEFSDVKGHKINARNILFIATSNAGSEMLFALKDTEKDQASKKEKIVASIIQEGIFKPELINRFDAVVLFHPLDDSHLKDIVTLSLRKLQERLKEKSVLLQISDELVAYLMSKGTDTSFGARPINRAIQDEVEQLVATKLIDGSIQQGNSVSFIVDQNQKLDIQIL